MLIFVSVISRNRQGCFESLVAPIGSGDVAVTYQRWWSGSGDFQGLANSSTSGTTFGEFARNAAVSSWEVLDKFCSYDKPART